jgi:hypothetical protein
MNNSINIPISSRRNPSRLDSLSNSQIPQVQSSQQANSNVDVRRNPLLHWCVKIGRHKTHLFSVPVPSLTDPTMLKKLKSIYQTVQGWRRWLSLTDIYGINFIAVSYLFPYPLTLRKVHNSSQFTSSSSAQAESPTPSHQVLKICLASKPIRITSTPTEAHAHSSPVPSSKSSCTISTLLHPPARQISRSCSRGCQRRRRASWPWAVGSAGMACLPFLAGRCGKSCWRWQLVSLCRWDLRLGG